MSLIPRRRLGRTNVSITELGLGGAGLGELFERVTNDDAVATLAAAWDQGIRYFDTAPFYGHGLSEQRFGWFLRDQPRDSYVVSTKVGRVFRAPADLDGFRSDQWVGGLPFDYDYDYRRDGVVRSFEQSLLRLGLNRVDTLVIHDIDTIFHGAADGVDRCLDELDQGGGFAVLSELRDAGVIGAIGVGMNESGTLPKMLGRFDLDFVILAMPYTLIDQTALHEELVACADHDVAVVVGAPFASGILATGSGGAGKCAYGDPTADALELVRSIESVCAAHDVSLPAAALQFAVAHPTVAAVIPGATTPEHVRQNAAGFRSSIPAAFWTDLREAGLIDRDAPVPSS